MNECYTVGYLERDLDNYDVVRELTSYGIWLLREDADAVVLGLNSGKPEATVGTDPGYVLVTYQLHL